MNGALLLLLYGLCVWGAGLNFPAWARLAWTRWREPARPGWWRDPILLTRLGLTVLSLGAANLAFDRVYGTLSGEMPLTVPSWRGVMAIGLMAAAEPLFLRVDEIHAKARGGWSLSWRLYWAGALAWSLAAAAQAAIR